VKRPLPYKRAFLISAIGLNALIIAAVLIGLAAEKKWITNEESSRYLKYCGVVFVTGVVSLIRIAQPPRGDENVWTKSGCLILIIAIVLLWFAALIWLY
jgi:hypothetical protein